MQNDHSEDEGFVPAQFQVKVGEKTITLTTPEPTGLDLLKAGGIDPEAHYLVQQFNGGDAIPVDADDSVDLRRHGIERFLPVAKKKLYPIYVDEKPFDLANPRPTGTFLLELVGLKACGYELVQKIHGHPDQHIDPEETVDVRKPGIEKFYSVEKDEVSITVRIEKEEKVITVPRGEVEVALIRKLASIPEKYHLYSAPPGPPLPLADDGKVVIQGCEVFPTQVRRGESS